MESAAGPLCAAANTLKDSANGSLSWAPRPPCTFGEKHLRSGDRRHGSESRVTELIQPLSDVAPMRQVPAQPRSPARPPSFTELVYAHHDWWRVRQAGTPDPAVAAEYDFVRAAFEAAHGRIVRAYWCSHVESAVALTEKKRFRGLLAPTYGFHRESDWATKNDPDVTSELHRCDTLA